MKERSVSDWHSAVGMGYDFDLMKKHKVYLVHRISEEGRACELRTSGETSPK
jgi:hypothetical protein